jgi:hypothetical protein
MHKNKFVNPIKPRKQILLWFVKQRDKLSMPFGWHFLILFTIFLIILIPGSTLAQTTNGFSMTVEAGFDGQIKDGQWIPVRVTLENNGADLQGYIRINFTDSGTASDIYEYPLVLPSVSRKEVVVYVRSEGYSRTLKVVFLSEKKILESVQLQLDNYSASDFWYGIIAGNPTTFNILSQLSTANSTARTIQLDIEDLPDRSYVLKSLNVLILSDVDTGKLTGDQRQSLVDWTAAGGRLIITGGSSWIEKTIAGLKETGLLPLLPAGSQSVNDLDDLQRFAQSSEPLFASDQAVEVTTGGIAEGSTVLAKTETGIPLLLRKRFGAGDVFFLTFNPVLPTFKNWLGREDFFRSLVSIPLDKPSWLLGIRGWSQAKEAALTLPNLSLPSPLLICGFLVIYILALGPFNYLLVRALKRSDWGWVTIPVMVLFFSTAIILIGSVSRGNRVVLNRLAVIQVWNDTDRARVDGVLGVYSPTRSTYQVEVDAPTLLYPLLSDYGASTSAYTIQETSLKSTIPGVKLDISGIDPFAFEGSTPAPSFQHNLILELNPLHPILQGNITNNSNLNLNDAVLLFPGGYFQIGDFPPGATVQVNQFLLKAQLAGETNLNPTFPYVTTYSGNPTLYSFPTDTTVTDILGTGNYYDDRSIYRKYSILSAVINNGYGTGSSRGSGVYLGGWTDQLPVDIGIADQSYRTQDNVLYLISLQPALSTDDVFTLSPGAFSWSLLEGNDPSLSPYGANLYPGTVFSFQFTPILPIEFSGVKSLILHLDGSASGSGVSGVTVSTWDYEKNVWAELDDLRWGDNTLYDPSRYMGSDGSLRLQINNVQIGGIQITQADFSVELEK